ncbi:unnamed protein product [Caenorhabditis angaria]|uniref:Cell division cycle protein 27 homolog n=1 Tax=Caenorhabditis angaria TaxID=860376 RepID=A0A9P1IAY7_9PELO|nr:unnamed protein product [Caenorhabditis angaria]
MLKFYAYDDAIFLAELNFEKENSDESLYLFADCLIRSNKKEECYGLLKTRVEMPPKLRYIFAKCCFDLSKMEDCQNALFEQESGEIRAELLEDEEVAPHARFLYSALLCEEAHPEDAVSECETILQNRILMWSVISSYVKYGGKNLESFISEHRKKIYENSKILVTNEEELVNKPSASSSSTSQTTTLTPRKSSRISEQNSKKVSARQAATPAKTVSTNVTRTTQSSRNRSNVLSSDTENVHMPRTRGSTISSTNRAAGAIPKTHPTRSSTRNSDVAKMLKSPSLRKRDVIKQPLSSRNSNLVRSLSGSTNSISSISDEKQESLEILQFCSSSSSSSTSQNPSESAENAAENPMDPSQNSASSSSSSPSNSASSSEYSKEYRQFFEMFANLALIEESVGHFNWKKTDKLFLENGSKREYGECRTILDELHKRRPWRVEGTELLSTSLWHLQDTHGLSALAQTLTSENRERAESWCAAGNCFSLQRQHSQAIECMERAIQLDKRFAYAYTLLAHELIVQDELDKAAGAFKSALLLSPRDYRAWYGLGLVHLKKEQNSVAQTNIQKAISINPTNRAMLCTLSNLEQQRGKSEKALKLIDKALELNPTDLACRFNRARLLYEAKRNDECLVELNRLKASSPDEAVVFHFVGWAAELDPRSDQNLGGGSNGGGNGSGTGGSGAATSSGIGNFGGLSRDDEDDEEYDDDDDDGQYSA